MKNTVIVTGIKDIDRRLRTLPGRVQKKVTRKAMRDGLKIMAAEVKKQAPVDTGLTQRNIKVKATRRKKRGSVELEVTISGKDSGLIKTPKTGGGKPVFYPAVVEYGREGVEPNPFMRRAYENKAAAARDETMRSLRNGVEQEATKG